MNITKRFLTMACSGLVLTPLVHAQRYVCHHGDQIREIQIVYEIPGQTLPCSVVYRKAGTEETLWNAQAEIGYCENRASEFAEKQRAWGWTCEMQISQTEDSHSEEEGSASDVEPNTSDDL